jgi:lipopolysaccharide biosynthesis regulator YciM
LIAAMLIICGAFLLHAELESWLQHVPAGPALAALFRSVPMPGGAVSIALPPAQSRPALTKLISAAQHDAMLYRLRAQEAETALDFAAAETDWKSYAQAAADRYGALIELADFYHRRIEARDEIAALSAAAAAAKDDPLLLAIAQRAWGAFVRMAAVAGHESLPESVTGPIFHTWVDRYRKEPQAWRKLIDHLVSTRQFAAAEAEIAQYGRVFDDLSTPVSMRADLESRRDRPDAALAIYDRAFQPLWPQDLTAGYFKLLEQQNKLREFAGRAHTALAANPADLDATARLFAYFQAQNNAAAARRVLLEYRMAKESGAHTGPPQWTPDELQTTAQLFERLPDVNEAARLYYALYSIPPANGPRQERALYGLANLLLTAPDQPIQFGSGDLSFYKDIAAVDSSPGFLNGILSLVLNGTRPRWEYQLQNQKSAAYFHRAAAEQLTGLLEQRFPKSAYREVLRAILISAYGVYGDDAAVIRAGRQYLADFPSGASRVAVALQVSDALARANRTGEEFALYDQLLRELAAKASGVPVGATPASARSAAYTQVLDKYLSRLAELNRPLDALRVYRTEIARNPNDPGLYERLAAFLEQNGTSREVEEVYTKAIGKFADRSWYHKLARWYLRKKEYSALEKISRDVIAAFSGTELEGYFGDIVTQTHPDAALYLQLNRFAHARFPEDLVFVHNLLGAYGHQGTFDDAAYNSLLRQYWFYDPQLRTTLFAALSHAGSLHAELVAIRAANPGITDGRFNQAVAANPAAVEFDVEAEAWLCHFEAAAPAARALADAYPGRTEFTSKASALYRSLAAYDERNTGIAVSLSDYEQRANPGDSGILARMGDILADRDLFSRARAFWERMPALQPGNPEAYLDTATVYWDYYLYNDALRWIAAARRKFNDPAMFAYQAGAIYEGKRDYASAVREYVAGAVKGQAEAQSRLLRLLNRPNTRDLVDRATAAAIASDPSPKSLSLRVTVLEAQQRRQDLETLLETRMANEKSSTALADIEETARRLGFDAIEEQASQRLAAISSDPVDQMRLTLSYARLLESKKDIAGAARVVDALYRDHPLILGVVRAAVDFHVRNHQPAEAIGILLDAAKRARTDLAAQFTLESARIATAAGQFDRARDLLAGLLGTDPLNAAYLTAMADTYLQAKDDHGFRDYELATIQQLKQSLLTPAERIERIATVRRSLIPALERLHDSSGAVDQYIELVNSYPEDAALTKEAAAYAVVYGQAERMVAFYRQTITAAPRDYRWPIVLARVETVTEDYPAAIADYERGIHDRPDRADLLEAKGRLEERLMRFSDAIESYSRLYELSYRDPQWLIKVAELRARTGQNSGAVDALKTAIVGARTETADADFEIAERLEVWHILPAAVTFADRGAALAGADLLKQMNNAVIYARIMARARRMDALLPRLGANPAAEQQLKQEAGGIIAETYTPEEKMAFEQTLTARAATMSRPDREHTLLPLVEAAGLSDLEARWRFEAMAEQEPHIDPRFVTLQSQRGVYWDLGRQLELYAQQHPGRPVEGTAWMQAAEAFIWEGDRDSQMRVMREAMARNGLSGDLLDRYLAMLAVAQPKELVTLARGSVYADRAVQSAIAGDWRELAYASIQARGSGLPPVWTKAYTALAGLYFDDRAPAIGRAFQSGLDTRTIGERLKTPPQTDATIVGTVWFYYGARYGDYLLSGKSAAAEEWLPASLEAAPGNPDAYMALGDSYAASGQTAKAITQFEHALELDRDRGDADDHMARALWSAGRHAEAIASWKSALAVFLRVQSRGVRVPEPFWSRAAETFTDIGERHAFDELRPEIAHLIGDYYQRNREYRLNELIEPAARASIASGAGVEWLVELARSMDQPAMMLNTLIEMHGVSEAQRIELQRDLAAIWAKQAAATFGDVRATFENTEAQARMQLVSMLLDAGSVREAAAEWSRVPKQYAEAPDVDIAIRLASRTGALDALLGQYRAHPDSAPPADTLQRAAVTLRNDGDENGARTVLEYLYDRELHTGHLDAASFLGLAEIHLQRGNVAAAVALLNRMALVVEDGFETLLPAAELLAKYGKTEESAAFIRKRIAAVPWDAEAKVALARTLAEGSAERDQFLTAAATDSQAAYKLRAEAARLAAPHRLAGGSDKELALLSAGDIALDAVEKPYYLEARIRVADATSEPQTKLRLYREALAIAPTDGRVRLGTLRAALALHRDSLALALARTEGQPDVFNQPMSDYRFRRRYMPFRQPGMAAVLPPVQLTAAEQVTLAQSLAAAAERLDDLSTASSYLRSAIDLSPLAAREALQHRLDGLTAEQDRRAQNAAHQPAIKSAIEQDHVVRPRILRSAQ